MAFVKLYKVVVDSPIGFATINQLADNAADLRTQMLVQHGAVEFPKLFGSTIEYRALGRHGALDEVPKDVGYAATYVQSLSTTGVQFTWNGPGIPGVWRVGTGDYIIPIVGLSSYWAKVSLSASGTVTCLERVRPYAATAANGFNAGIRLNTFQLGAGDFVATDLSFGIALYGTP